MKISKMTTKYCQAITLLILMSVVAAQNIQYEETEYQCPRHWIKDQLSCYRFIKSPLKVREEARRACQAYQSDLIAINSGEEHKFIIEQLQLQDPQHRHWLTSAKMQGGYWANEADGAQLTNMENAFLPESWDGLPGRDYLAYAFSEGLRKWGLEKVTADEEMLYICEAPLSILHTVVEESRDYKYGYEIDNPLQVPRGPYFTKQPEDVIFDVSKRGLYNQVSLSCLAGGYPTPTYEWFRENYDNARLIATLIDPLTNNRYTVSGGNLIIHDPEQTEDRGSYHCKASNEYGTIISESVELSFGYILEFNLKRSAEQGDQNWGKVIFCDPPQHFPAKINYQWTRDAYTVYVEQDKRIFASSDGALYFSALEPIDRGNYSCTVQRISSNTGRIGPFFELKVNPHSSFQQLKFAGNFPKVFPEAPVAGEEVRLECMAFGYPVPSYNWTRDGTELPRGHQLSSYNRVLIIPHVKVEDQGRYTCTAYNERGSIHNTVWLKIQAKPQFTIPLEDRHMDNRGDLTWTCEAFGIPDVTYNWFKNGELLEMQTLRSEDRDRYFIQDNVFKIQHLDPQRDPAMYQCRAKNSLKTTYSSAQLRVLSLKPSFKKHPLEPETYAAERGNVTIVCNPEAAPRPKFVWKKDDLIIGAGGRRRILENGNLIISPVSIDDYGIYSCTASNEYGSDTSIGRLTVLRGPTFVEQLPVRITTAVMYNQTLRCQGDSDSMLDIAYIWTHNGIRIRDKDLHDNPRWIINDGVFDIINITLSDAGDYECILKSAVGEVKSKTTLIIEGPPGPPGGLKVVNIIKTSVTLQWTDGAYNGRPIIMYTISAQTEFINHWFNITENITNAIEIDRYTGRKEAFLENVLNPFTTYEFRVSAANELGYGPPSLPSGKHNTVAARPTKAPAKVGGGGGKFGDLKITWEPLPPQDRNGRGIHYKVYWRKKGHEEEFQTLLLKEFGNVDHCVVNVQRDNYFTEYEVRVQAINEAGAGPLSEIKTIFSAEGMPQVQPQRVSALAHNSTSLNVSWVPLDESREIVRGKLIGYRIKYWLSEGQEEEANYYLSRTRRPWSLIVGLQPDTYYYVKVMAYNSAGAGPESERYLERTYRSAPQNPPSTVRVYQHNPSTVRVEWRYVQASVGEEPLDGYKVRVWEIDQDMTTANHTIVPARSKLEAYVTNLSPGKTYNLRVLAFSKGGDGRMSSPTNTFQMGDPAMFRNSAKRMIPDVGIELTVLIILRQLNLI